MGDRTQILTLMLAARLRKPWPILAGVLGATLVDHGLAALIGMHLGRLLTPAVRDASVGVSLVLMSLWTLAGDPLEERPLGFGRMGAFTTTLVTFFIAEMGDKTQIATLALAAAYSRLTVVVAGATCGMMLANAPVVFLGKWFAERLPVKAIHYAAGCAFLVLGVIFLVRAGQLGL